MMTVQLGDRPIFVYGTLMSAELRSALLGGRDVVCSTAVLPASAGYRRFRVQGQRYPALVRDSPNKGEAITGELLTGLTPNDVELLVEYEGDEYYVSSAEALVNDNSVAVEAAVFLWKDSLRSQLITDGDSWDFVEWLETGLSDAVVEASSVFKEHMTKKAENRAVTSSVEVEDREGDLNKCSS